MTVNVLWHSLRVPWVGLQCVFVVFPDQTHLLCRLKARLSAVYVALPDVNVKVSNQICMTQCSCDAVGCAYPVGLQIVGEPEIQKLEISGRKVAEF